MPVNLPLSAFKTLDIGAELGIVSARTEGGLVITSRRADPYWHGTITTDDLDPRGDNERADFLAWLTWAADLNMRVDFVHPRHRLPRAYTAATWPMIGNGALVDTPDVRTLTVRGIPAGVQLKRSDRISVLQDDIVIHRWIAQDVLVGSQIAQPIAITPRLPIGVLAPEAVVVLQDPKMRFAIEAGSWAESQAETYGPAPVTFSVMEALR